MTPKPLCDPSQCGFRRVNPQVQRQYVCPLRTLKGVFFELSCITSVLYSFVDVFSSFSRAVTHNADGVWNVIVLNVVRAKNSSGRWKCTEEKGRGALKEPVSVCSIWVFASKKYCWKLKICVRLMLLSRILSEDVCIFYGCLGCVCRRVDG